MTEPQVALTYRAYYLDRMLLDWSDWLHPTHPMFDSRPARPYSLWLAFGFTEHWEKQLADEIERRRLRNIPKRIRRRLATLDYTAHERLSLARDALLGRHECE